MRILLILSLFCISLFGGAQNFNEFVPESQQFPDYIIPVEGKSFKCRIVKVTASEIEFTSTSGQVVQKITKDNVKSYYSSALANVTLDEIEQHCKLLYPGASMIYCTVFGSRRPTNPKKNFIYISYGQDPFVEQKILDDNKKEIFFVSLEDALNRMSEHGWIYEDAFIVTAGDQDVYHFLMKKYVND